MKQLLWLCAPMCLFACLDVEAGDPDDTDIDESEITVIGPVVPGPVGPTLPPVQLAPSHNRMIWRDLAGVNGELWIVNDLGGVNARTAFSFANREVLGVAGDRVLWRNGANAEMRSFDDNGVLGTTVFAVTNPDPARFEPRSIALATNFCWSKASQDYYVLWDDMFNNEVAIQLIDNTGFQRRVNFVRKPLNSTPALWFGIAGDGFEELMMRSGFTQFDGWLFRAAWSTANANFVVTPTAKSVKSRTAHQPTHTGRVVASSLFFRGTWDQMLFTELDAQLRPTNRAKLELYQTTGLMPPVTNSILAGNPPVVYSYTGAAGQHSRAFAGNPNLCQ
jgi:hypothetical protein